ncbi:hypothetical protein [Paenimyroides ceti]
MKKMLFLAIPMIALVGNVFASNFGFTKLIEEQTTPCRWRTEYTHSDGKKSWGPWTYGNCNKTVNPDGSIVLSPVK